MRAAMKTAPAAPVQFPVPNRFGGVTVHVVGPFPDSMAQVERIRMQADAARRAGDKGGAADLRQQADDMITRLQARGRLGALDWEDTAEEDGEEG